MSASPSSDPDICAGEASDAMSVGAGGFDEVSAGGVVVRRFDGEHRILLILDPYGKWALPKGHLEGEEGPREAAEREVREETGLHDLSVGPKVDRTTWSFRREGSSVRKMCTYYLMTSQAGEARPEVTEGITECEWLPPAEAVERVQYDNTRDVIREAERMIRNGVTDHEGSAGR